MVLVQQSDEEVDVEQCVHRSYAQVVAQRIDQLVDNDGTSCGDGIHTAAAAIAGRVPCEVLEAHTIALQIFVST